VSAIGLVKSGELNLLGLDFTSSMSVSLRLDHQ